MAMPSSSPTVPLPADYDPAATYKPYSAASVISYLRRIANGELRLLPSQRAELAQAAHALRPEPGTAQQPEAAADSFDFHTLLNYMTSDQANALQCLEPMDATQPLSHYFISSSHNTYLQGNQIWGNASSAVYRDILLRGCRCVEIDVWNAADIDEARGDAAMHNFMSRLSRRHSPHSTTQRSRDNSPSNQGQRPVRDHSADRRARLEPRVLHGHTLTREVPFREVCEVIRDAAFVTSLEVHADQDQQEIMVDIMRQCWKDFLVPVPDRECESLPSPDDLRHKILVKVKAGVKKPDSGSSATTVTALVDDSSSGEEREKAIDASAAPLRSKKDGIISSLSDLGVYTRGYHFKSFSQPEAKIPAHIFSLSESKLMEANESHGPELLAHNRSFLMRAFPSGKRVASSNLDPVRYWQMGVQIAALNWQNVDEGVMLNEAQFAGTGGWVLKPECLRQDPPTLQKPDAFDVRVEILAAQGLPSASEKSRGGILHPYVRMELHTTTIAPDQRRGHGRHISSDTDALKQSSRVTTGSEPDFGGELLQLVGPRGYAELSFLRFEIKEDVVGRNPVLAWACVRLDRLRTGYRLLHLNSPEGAKTDAVLLLNIIQIVTQSTH